MAGASKKSEPVAASAPNAPKPGLVRLRVDHGSVRIDAVTIETGETFDVPESKVDEFLHVCSRVE